MATATCTLWAMSDSEWSDSDDAAVAFEALGDRHPVRRASLFFAAVRDGGYGPEILEPFVTPEVRADWGDFSEIRGVFLGLDRPGIGSIANEAVGAPDVVYVKVLEQVDRGYWVTEEAPVRVPGVFTMIWRPDHDAWLIHRFGEYALPEDLPRTSPGAAPKV